jgi:hypothetical protein
MSEPAPIASSVWMNRGRTASSGAPRIHSCRKTVVPQEGTEAVERRAACDADAGEEFDDRRRGAGRAAEGSRSALVETGHDGGARLGITPGHELEIL